MAIDTTLSDTLQGAAIPMSIRKHYHSPLNKNTSTILRIFLNLRIIQNTKNGAKLPELPSLVSSAGCSASTCLEFQDVSQAISCTEDLITQISSSRCCEARLNANCQIPRRHGHGLFYYEQKYGKSTAKWSPMLLRISLDHLTDPLATPLKSSPAATRLGNS
jgi:hypothetical protein